MYFLVTVVLGAALATPLATQQYRKTPSPSPTPLKKSSASSTSKVASSPSPPFERRQILVQCTTTAIPVIILDKSGYCGCVQPSQLPEEPPWLFQEREWFGPESDRYLERNTGQAALNVKQAGAQGDAAMAGVNTFAMYRCCILKWIIDCQKARMAAGGVGYMKHDESKHFKKDAEYGWVDSSGCDPIPPAPMQF